MNRLVAFALVAAACGICSQSAAASPITINVGNFSGGTGVLHAPGTLADGLNVYLGSVAITGDLGAFESYCVDLQHFDQPGPNQTVVDSMANWANTATPAHPSLGPAAASWLYLTYAGAAAGNQNLEASLSLAIWNALYDNDYDVSGGTGFWATSLSNGAYATTANLWLGALSLEMQSGAALPYAMWLRTADGRSNTSQDFIGPARVPEPATLLLFGTGAALVALRRRRGQRDNVSPTVM